ncbi:transposase, partial [Wolbachia endosymbiont of Mansonella perstans]|nr:transposase [Wolbachia endosymbiont of Mansonella perstans]
LYKEEAIFEYKLEEGIKKVIQIGEECGIQIGKERGEKQAKITVAKKLLKVGVSVDLATEFTGLPKTKIVQLQEEMA